MVELQYPDHLDIVARVTTLQYEMLPLEIEYLSCNVHGTEMRARENVVMIPVYKEVCQYH